MLADFNPCAPMRDRIGVEQLVGDRRPKNEARVRLLVVFGRRGMMLDPAGSAASSDAAVSG